jgi:hypothetical protein
MRVRFQHYKMKYLKCLKLLSVRVYVCACVCVCTCWRSFALPPQHHFTCQFILCVPNTHHPSVSAKLISMASKIHEYDERPLPPPAPVPQPHVAPAHQPPPIPVPKPGKLSFNERAALAYCTCCDKGPCQLMACNSDPNTCEHGYHHTAPDRASHMSCCIDKRHVFLNDTPTVCEQCHASFVWPIMAQMTIATRLKSEGKRPQFRPPKRCPACKKAGALLCWDIVS